MAMAASENSRSAGRDTRTASGSVLPCSTGAVSAGCDCWMSPVVGLPPAAPALLLPLFAIALTGQDRAPSPIEQTIESLPVPVDSEAGTQALPPGATPGPVDLSIVVPALNEAITVGASYESLAAAGSFPIAVPPSLTMSVGLRSAALPTPITVRRSRFPRPPNISPAPRGCCSGHDGAAPPGRP